MKDIFDLHNGKSPVDFQDFVWLASYYDGTYDTEYDFKTLKGSPNKFYQIKRDKLLRFGLVGHGSKLYFDVPNGVFYINGQPFKFMYEVNGKKYGLTGSSLMYNDIITYKNAVSEANPTTFLKEGMFTNKIIGYNFGFKKRLIIDGVEINFQCICNIPYDDSAFFEIKITTNQDLDGKLQIYRANKEVANFEAPLKAGLSGNINWKLR